ncbi:UNKNOWN [Stylonychia lemnae]|uniref:Arrestin-like N-terminal domain-containing protein n=1 Tax=Stylonychia lemnae TaxID=5949 RepID=A0A078AGS8_STYLE|nr:UNKNOWN [Stylonychia lemnae]|eukprot:CDW81409.1 UNKNOWN [Stylonychia lemnae]
MGQKQSNLPNFQGGLISIELNKFNWISGEKLTGVVNLQMRDPFTTDKIVLRFVGQEKCYFDSADKGASAHGKGDIKAKNQIHFQEIVLESFHRNELLPGAYSYPFAIDLPYWLPSSFLYCGIQRCIMKIDYFLLVGMEDYSRQFRPLFLKKLVNISQPPVMINHKVSRSISHEVKNLFFVDMGLCSASATIDKDTFQPNELVKIDMKIDNSHCNQGISKLKMTLKREVICYSQNGKMVYRHTEKIGEMQQEGQHEKSSQNRIIAFDMNQVHPMNTQTDNYLKYTQLIPQEIKGLAQHLAPSINTVLLKCLYTIEIKLDHGLLSLANRMPSLKFPIFIYPSSIPKGMQIQDRYPIGFGQGQQIQHENPYVNLQQSPYHSNVIYQEQQYSQQLPPGVSQQYPPNISQQQPYQFAQQQYNQDQFQSSSQVSASPHVTVQQSPQDFREKEEFKQQTPIVIHNPEASMQQQFTKGQSAYPHVQNYGAYEQFQPKQDQK